MLTKILKILNNFFGLTMMFSVLMGAVVAVMFVLGFIVSGEFGAQLAILGAKIMKYCITIAAIGSVVGMGGFYLEGKHELLMNRND